MWKGRYSMVVSTHHCLGGEHAIVDTQQFSNHLLRLSIEVAVARLDELLVKIESAGVSLSQGSKEDALAEAEIMAGRTPATRLAGTLVIRFVSDEPDLRIRVPALPG